MFKLGKVERIRIRAGGGDDGVRIDESVAQRPRAHDDRGRRTASTACASRGPTTASGSGCRRRARACASLRDTACQAIDLGGVEQVRAATLGGADTVTVDDTTGTELQDLGVDLAAAEGGDGRRDRVIVNATPGDDQPSVFAFAGVSIVGVPAFVHVEGSEPIDRLTINGRGGDDLLSATTVGSDAPALTLDGGPGDDVLFGGDGDDVLIGGPGFDDVQGRRGDDVVDLGSDIDRFIWNPGDGSDVVDGQGGHDVLFFFGTNDAETLDLSPRGHGLRLARDVDERRHGPRRHGGDQPRRQRRRGHDRPGRSRAPPAWTRSTSTSSPAWARPVATASPTA